MWGMTRELNTDEAIRNLSILSESDQLDEKPDWQTVNNYLEKLEPYQLEQVQFSMIRKLIRTKDFSDYTLDGRYIVVIDGTGYAYFPHKHCEHDLATKKKILKPEKYGMSITTRWWKRKSFWDLVWFSQ